MSANANNNAETDEAKHRVAVARLVHAAQSLLISFSAPRTLQRYKEKQQPETDDGQLLEGIIERNAPLFSFLAPQHLSDVRVERFRAQRCGFWACPHTEEEREAERNKQIEGGAWDTGVVVADGDVVSLPADSVGARFAPKTRAELRAELEALRRHREEKNARKMERQLETRGAKTTDDGEASVRYVERYSEDPGKVLPQKRIVRDSLTGKLVVADSGEENQFCSAACRRSEAELRAHLDQTPPHLRPSVLPGLLKALDEFRVLEAAEDESVLVAPVQTALAGLSLGDGGASMQKTPAVVIVDRTAPRPPPQQTTITAAATDDPGAKSAEPQPSRPVYHHRGPSASVRVRKARRQSEAQEKPAEAMAATADGGGSDAPPVLELVTMLNSETNQLEGQLVIRDEPGNNHNNNSLPVPVSVPVPPSSSEDDGGDSRSDESDDDELLGAAGAPSLMDFFDPGALTAGLPALSPFATLFMFLESSMTAATRDIFTPCTCVADAVGVATGGSESPSRQPDREGDIDIDDNFGIDASRASVGSIALDDDDVIVARQMAVQERADMMVHSFTGHFGPVTGLPSAVASVVRSFRVDSAVPTLSMAQWRTMVTAIVVALARVAARDLETHAASACSQPRVASPLFAKIVADNRAALESWIREQCQTGTDEFECLVDVLYRKTTERESQRDH
jgi:hypothetical protein